MADRAVIETAPGPGRPSPRWTPMRVLVEAVTLAVVLAPAGWLALHWHALPVFSRHLHHRRSSLWIMPVYSLLIYMALSEFGLLSRMTILHPGQRLARLRPIFLAYFLTTRLELLVFFAVLSFAMDRTALSGQPWSARGFIAASLTCILLTILLFIVQGARGAYRMARPHS